jgi:hypothetical protein
MGEEVGQREHLGSARKLDAKEARQKAKAMKAEALWMRK